MTKPISDKSARYRFQASDFMNHDMSLSSSSLSRYGLEEYQAERIAVIANAILEQWERENTVLNGSFDNDLGWSIYPDHRDTHQAFLWRPEKIEGEEK